MSRNRKKGRDRLLSPAFVRKTLGELGVRPRRTLGQNFLVDPNIVRLIERASRISPADSVIEVGAGMGALTQMLAKKCSLLIAVESDRALARFLAGEFSEEENIRIVCADALKLDLSAVLTEIDRPCKMISNLPYKIAATLITRWLKEYPFIGEYVVTVQKEVAGRFLATPGSRDYSQATVKAGYYAKIERLASVSASCFYPKPAVESAILRFKRYDTCIKRPAEIPLARDEDLLDTLITAAFQQRRKKIVNSILGSAGLNIDGQALLKCLEASCVRESQRAENLDVEQFVRLANLLFEVTAGMPPSRVKELR